MNRDPQPQERPAERVTLRLARRSGGGVVAGSKAGRRVLVAAALAAVGLLAVLVLASGPGAEGRTALGSSPRGHAAAPGAAVSQPSSHRTAVENRRAAIRNARSLLATVVLPAGAERVAREPSGDGGVLAHPAQVPAFTDIVDVHAWWRVPRSATSVFRFVKAHLPSGAYLTGWGRNIPAAGWFVDFERSSVPGVFESRDSMVEIVALGPKEAGVRVDSQVVWTVPRPPSEQVPSVAREIDVTRGRLGRLRYVTIHVTNGAKVAKLVSAIDQLPIVQPSVVLLGCTPMTEPTVTFTFLCSRSSNVLARAIITGYCGGFAFTVRGRSQPMLDDAYKLVTETQQLLGVPLMQSR